MDLAASDALVGPALAHERGRRLRIEGDKIVAIEPGPPPGPRRLALPALANAHDHARPLALTSFGSAFLPLESWLPRSVLVTPPDPYLAAAAPLARSARAGAAAVMVHYTRPSGLLPILDEASEVARAATDVGVRMTFALAVRDQNPLVYGPSDEVLTGLPPEDRREIDAMFVRPAVAAREHLDLTEAIAAAIEGPTIQVQLGPAGVQWCSPALLEAIAEHSALTGRRVHMHLLETRYQRDWARRAFPRGILMFLKEIGLLSPRLTVAHAIYATEAERAMIAEAGATIVTNPSSNLHLRSGIAPIRSARAQGCRVCVGVDGLALDEDDDLIRETRLASLLHGPLGFDDPDHNRRFWAEAISVGRASLGVPGSGALAPGEPADILVLDLDALDRDALGSVDPLDLVVARGTAAHVDGLIVAGRPVVAGGRVLGIDLPAVEEELRAKFRASLAGYEGFRSAWPAYEARLKAWYRERAGCC